MHNPTTPRVEPIHYSVLLNETNSPCCQTLFECKADDEEHAEEQAFDAYPSCVVNEVLMTAKIEWAWGLHPGSAEYQYESLLDLLESCDMEAGDIVSKCPVVDGVSMIKAAVPYTITDDDVGATESHSNSVKIRLTLDVTYALNGENSIEMGRNLLRMCNRAIGEGMLTGESNAEVDESDIQVEILPEPLEEDAIAKLMLHRIDSGDLALEDIPTRLARYGLMEPHAFVREVQERMQSADAD
jgi:hypothetical protein